MEKLILQYQN